MALIGALNAVAAIFWLGAVGGLVLAGYNASRGHRPRPGIILLVIGITGGILLTVLNFGLVLVQPDERAVVFRQIGRGPALLPEPLQPGLNWIIPFVDTAIPYSVARQNVTMTGSAAEGGTQAGVLSGVRGRSSDGQEVLVDVTVLYIINETRVNDIHQNWKRTYEESFIVAQTRSVLRDNIDDFTAEEIFSGARTEVQTNTGDILQPKFAEEGFILIDVLIRDVTFSPEFADSIERKQIAEQEANRAVFLVQQQEQEAARAVVEAQGLADAVAIRAEGDAIAIITIAAAEAEGLRLINEQISQNPLLIQFRYIQELGDNVRLIIIPSNSPFLFDIEALTGGQLGALGGTSSSDESGDGS